MRKGYLLYDDKCDEKFGLQINNAVLKILNVYTVIISDITILKQQGNIVEALPSRFSQMMLLCEIPVIAIRGVIIVGTRTNGPICRNIFAG